MVAQVVTLIDRSYELRYNRCGKRNCGVCYGDTATGISRPGHGPYWYLCVPFHGKWLRIYLGKTLDTQRFADDHNKLDWTAIKAYRTDRSRARSRARATSTTPTKEPLHGLPTPQL